MRIASYSVATLRGILVLPKFFRARPDVIFLIVTIQDGQAREPYKLNIHASDVQIVGVMTTVGVVKETKKGFVDSFHAVQAGIINKESPTPKIKQLSSSNAKNG